MAERKTIEKMKLETPDMTGKNVEIIGQLFPSAVTEMRGEDGKLKKGINFDILKQLLSPDVVEGEECYEFTWVGKRVAAAEAARPIAKTLRPIKEVSKNWDTTENLYIEGDNLEVLKILQESYLGKVKMIYIDPPYNTGNDFVYPDSFMVDNDKYNEGIGYFDEDGNINYKRKNSASAGKYHSDWCSMMYSRLRLASNLLTNDGIIFISIDENEIVNLRKICDDIFGSDQFVAQIVLLCNPKGRSQDKYIANCHEYILIYSKYVLENGSISIPKTAEEIAKDYPLFDAEGQPYRELELRNTHQEFGRFNRQNLWYPFYVSSSGEISLDKDENSEEIYPIWDDGFEGCWTWGKEKAQQELSLLVAKHVAGKVKIYRKAYAYIQDELPLKQVKSIWTDKSFFTEKGQLSINTLLSQKGKIFQSPKSPSMIAQCILMAQNKDALILDFFSGSATTAHAVMQLNAEDGGHRKFIMVQLPEPCDEKSEAYKAGYKNICEIGKERIRRAGDKIRQEHPDAELDTGFRVFRVDSGIRKDVYLHPEELQQEILSAAVDNIKDDRDDMDLLYACLLDWGVEIHLPHVSDEVDGCTVHNVDDGALMACFDKDVPVSVVEYMAERQPLRAVFRDSAFLSDDAKINVTEIFKNLSPDTKVKVI